MVGGAFVQKAGAERTRIARRCRLSGHGRGDHPERCADGDSYHGAEGTIYWGPSPMWVRINNLLMVLAFYFYAASAAKGAKIWLGTKIRHPQLSGFSVWAIAHLLVNGDTPSLILFGGLLVWAQVEIQLINAQEGPWVRPARAPVKKEVVAAVVTLVMVTVVMDIHFALGVKPWG